MNKDVRAGDRKGKGNLWGKVGLKKCGLLGSGIEMISSSLSLGKNWVCGWEEWGDRPQPDQRVVIILMASAEKGQGSAVQGCWGNSPSVHGIPSPSPSQAIPS